MVVLSSLGTGAWAQSLEEGAAIAETACGACHALPDADASGTARDLAEISVEEDWRQVPLRQWLATAHPYLPPLAMTSAELWELENYLLDLRAATYFGEF